MVALFCIHIMHFTIPTLYCITAIINTEVLQASESGYCTIIGCNSDVGIFVLQIAFTESGFAFINC